ncbi:hypothetical protein KR054_011012 [Drosophila jambulina]|nr:hypothetical protein KR054_011012 [Drosophila jambulina]
MKYRDRQFWAEFLLLYRSLPAVWKVQSPDYGSRELKNAGYEQLVRKLREVEPDASRIMVVRKINSFRTNYRRDMRRREHFLRIGEPFQSSLWYFDLLSFLEGQEKGARSHRRTERKSQGLRQSAKGKEGDQVEAPNCESFQDIKVEEEMLCPATCNSPVSKSVTLENSYGFPTFPEIPGENTSSMHRLSETEALTQAWGHQFEELSQSQRTLARKLISDILYYGCLEQLDARHVDQMHQLMSRKDIESNRISFKDNS